MKQALLLTFGLILFTSVAETIAPPAEEECFTDACLGCTDDCLEPEEEEGHDSAPQNYA